MILDLPTPPSTNNLFINVKRGRARSREYDGWRTHAGLVLNSQKPTSYLGPVSVTLVAQENGRRDLDGYWKPILDLLVTHGVIKNDNCKVVRELKAWWSPSVEGCRVSVMPWVDA